jgi:hypothetical protein
MHGTHNVKLISLGIHQNFRNRVENTFSFAIAVKFIM